MRRDRGITIIEPLLFLALIGLVLLLVIASVDLFYFEPKRQEEFAMREGYQAGDVKAFCKVYDTRVGQIETSPAMKKQFDKFVLGESVDLPVQKKRVAVVPVIVR